MYESFQANGFRCFEHFAVDGFARVNLIAGLNNVGKTALLEALFLHSGAYNPLLTLVLTGLRLGPEPFRLELGPAAEPPWNNVFWGYDTSKTVELAGKLQSLGWRTIRLRVAPRAAGLVRDWRIGGTQDNGVLGGAMPLGVTEVLELEHEEGDQRQVYRMALGREGPRLDPPPPLPPFPCYFYSDHARSPTTEDSELFGRLQVEGEAGFLADVLRLIEPRLERVEMVYAGGQASVHGDPGIGRLLPLALMGGGMARLAGVVLRIANARGGVVLVDEVENGLHHSVMTEVWRAVREAARRFDAQIFATTHSWENIVAAHQAFSESLEYDFRLYRLERIEGDVRATAYDKETLEAAIESALDVR